MCLYQVVSVVTHVMLTCVLSFSTVRQVVLNEGRRADGRGVTDIRPIRSRAQLLPRTHGSCLFTRGETQVRRCPYGWIARW